MEYTILGRTGLKVSVVGLGCGGPSRVGAAYTKDQKISKEESIAVIQQAINSGINFIDTSEIYRTEKIVGEAIKNVKRESLIISTKKGTFGKITPEDVKKSFERSLKALDTDYIDIYHLHAVVPREYEYFYSEIVPTLLELRDQGKMHFLGITEMFTNDTKHVMLQRALEDDIWDVMMVGFNILNQSARELVFPKTIEKNIGILIMFAVRLALSRPKRLKQVMNTLIEKKQLDPTDFDEENPLNFLVHKDGADSLVDAAYRFCRYEPGTHVILSGTGNSNHLKSNIESFSRPPLPQEDLEKLKKIFQNVDSVSGH